MLLLTYIGWRFYRVACVVGDWWREIRDPFDIED